MGMSAHRLEPLLKFSALIKEGELAVVSLSVEELTGHKPRTFAEWAQENIEAFQ